MSTAHRNAEPEKTVLIVGLFLSQHGRNPTVCEDLALHLAGAGWRVLTTSDRLGRLARVIDMVRAVRRMRHAYSVAQVDVYSGAAFIWAEAVCWVLRRAGKPFVLSLHGGNLPAFARRRPRRVRRLLSAAAAVTAPSRYLYEAMQPYCEHLTLLPNPLDLGAYPFRLREQPHPKLIWLRALQDIYNPMMALRVFMLLDCRDAELLMIGPDKGEMARVQAAVQAMGLQARARLVGRVPKGDVPRWLDAGDIFLNTSSVDNTPISLMEAMAGGLPIISTDVGGIRDLVGENALLVTPNDDAAMAAAVRRVLSEPGLAAKLSRGGRKAVEAFDWTAILPRWEALLLEAQQ